MSRMLGLGLFGGALLLGGCGGRAREEGSQVPESLCEFAGAADAALPLELTRFGSEAMGASTRSVYLAESLGDGALVRVPRVGGSPRTLGTNLFYVEIRTSGADAYVISQGFAGTGSALYRLSAAEELILLDADLAGANDLVLAPAHLFLSDARRGVIYRYDRNGHGRTEVATDVGAAHLAADGETLYYVVDASDRAGLYRLEPDLTSTLVWGSPLNAPSRLFFLDGLLYSAGAGVRAYDLVALRDSTVCDGPSGIDDIVRVGTDFYFTTGIFQGDLVRVPVSGGEPEVLAHTLGYGGIATDGVSVFYDNGSSALAYCPPAEVTP